MSAVDPFFTAEKIEVGARYPVPTGWATPTELTHILRARGIIKKMAPQQIYTGFIRRKDSGFPYDHNLDGRIIVPIEEAIQWIVQWLQRKAEKEAAKAAEAAQRAQTAIEAANMTIEPLTTSLQPTEIEYDDEWSEWGNFA